MQSYFGHIKIPLQRVHIELTNICEFNCTFCPKSQMKRPFGYMDTNLAKRLISEISKEQICQKVTFHVMGEPTLHPDFFAILDHAEKEKMNVGLTTNGAKLGGAIGKQLVKYNLHQLDISLQTPNEQSFALRKAGSLTFTQYLQGILDFFTAYQQQWKNTIFKFRFLNTIFPKKEMEKKIGPIPIISSTKQLRDTFHAFAEHIYDILKVDQRFRNKALAQLKHLVAYKWHVVEIYSNIFFETYMLDDWGHAFADEKIYPAWAGYCFGMRDHFSILYSGDVTLCCMDFDGATTIGNLHQSSLREILSSAQLGKIINGFKKFRIVHPYCRRCLGSRTRTLWLLKPIASILALKLLKPFFYNRIKLDK
jgi:MoaA/NifB/PqqE/SkfB family radical SAM enzyme